MGEAQRFLRRDGVNAVEIFAESPEIAAPLRARLEGSFAEAGRFIDWQEANTAFTNALKVERNVMFLILSLIILVAAFNIVSGQYMLVKAKTGEIAILRTIGMSRGSVMRIFLMSGGMIGAAGTAGGWLLGVVITDNIRVLQGWVEALSGADVFSGEVYYLTTLPAVRDTKDVLLVVAISAALRLDRTALACPAGSRGGSGRGAAP